MSAIGLLPWNPFDHSSMSVERAIELAPNVEPNTPEAKGIVARLTDGATAPMVALRDLAARGDAEACRARIALEHLLTQKHADDVTVAQIRGRLLGLSDQDFMAWLRRAMK